MVRLAFTDRALAISGLPAFSEKFEALEASLGAAGDQIEAEVVRVENNSAASAHTAVWLAIGTMVAGVVVVLMLMAYLFFGVLRPLGALADLMSRLSRGEQGMAVIGRDRKYEIGEMARALAVFKETSEEARKLDAEVSDVIRTVVAAVEQLKQSATSSSASADETIRQSTVVSAAAESSRLARSHASCSFGNVPSDEDGSTPYFFSICSTT